MDSLKLLLGYLKRNRYVLLPCKNDNVCEQDGVVVVVVESTGFAMHDACIPDEQCCVHGLRGDSGGGGV